MSQLKVRTRGSSSPQGKQRVFFCCHEGDFAAYFESVSGEILTKQNCAVYYYEPDTMTDPQERELDLSQMQLFVLPVTTRLLAGENQAMADFDFAISHHIPVLPLMQEDGLEELFNRRCGDLQFLDKNAKDATAIGYDEKLTKYLESVLVGDELAEKIRAAFDAYVFLSYRKKDRKYAQELMRLIHKNDFCRDIAIWYDEFLTPGENFNDSIRDALEKSDLFALVVTPNLVNEPNYVASVEYPMARATGMNILPVRMTDTDEDALKAMYQGIDPPTDAHDHAALSKVLFSQVQALALRVDDADSRHNFFIGLAYLAGIDVEVDHQRALTLIAGAAEAGLPEAMEKLVDMYSSGEGVGRDHAAALHWQQVLVQTREKEYAVAGTAAAYADYSRALWDLGDYCTVLQDAAGAEAAFTAMHLQAELRLALDDSADVLRSLVISCSKLADMAKAQGDLMTAKSRCGQFMQQCRQLADQTHQVQDQRMLAYAYGELGDLSWQLGDLGEAQAFYQEYLSASRAIAERTGYTVSRQDTCAALTRLGDIVWEQGDRTGAQEHYQQAVELQQALVAEHPNRRNMRNLSVSCNKLGDLALSYGEFDRAESYFTRAMIISQELADRTGTASARTDLAAVWQRMGDLAQAKGDLSAAQSSYTRFYQLAQALTEETGTRQSRHMLSVSCDKLGKLAKQQKDLPAARRWFERQLEAHKALVDQAATPEALQDLAHSYHRMGDLTREEGDLVAAKSYQLQCLQLRLQVAEQHPSGKNDQLLSIAYQRLVDIEADLGNTAAAVDYADKFCRASIGRIETESQWLDYHYRMGNICKRIEAFSDAITHFQQVLQIRQRIAGAEGTDKDLFRLSLAYSDIAYTARQMGDHSTRQVYFEKELAVQQERFAMQPTADHRRDVMLSLHRLADAAVDRQDTAAAVALLLQAADWLKTASVVPAADPDRRTADDRQLHRDLIALHSEAAGHAEKLSDWATVKLCYEQMLHWGTCFPEDGTANVRRKLARCCEKLGNAARDNGSEAAAADYYLQAAELCETLAVQDGQTDLHRAAAVFWGRAGKIYRAMADYAAALRCYQRAAQVDTLLAERQNTTDARLELAADYQLLGATADDSGDSAAALDHYLQMLAISRAIADEENDEQSWYDLYCDCRTVAQQAEKLNDSETAARHWALRSIAARRMAQLTGKQEYADEAARLEASAQAVPSEKVGSPAVPARPGLLARLFGRKK